jgi:Rrf2 family protein
MLSGTTLSAIRALLFIGQQGPDVISPKKIALELGESPSYLSKVSGLLVKAGVLRAEKGVKGGVQLARPPSHITLLEVVEACQGAPSGGYCRVDCDPAMACSFHQAALELEAATVSVLSRWTLAKLLKKPHVTRRFAGGYHCVMLGPSQTKSKARKVSQ